MMITGIPGVNGNLAMLWRNLISRIPLTAETQRTRRFAEVSVCTESLLLQKSPKCDCPVSPMH